MVRSATQQIYFLIKLNPLQLELFLNSNMYHKEKSNNYYIRIEF